MHGLCGTTSSTRSAPALPLPTQPTSMILLSANNEKPPPLRTAPERSSSLLLDDPHRHHDDDAPTSPCHFPTAACSGSPPTTGPGLSLDVPVVRRCLGSGRHLCPTPQYVPLPWSTESFFSWLDIRDFGIADVNPGLGSPDTARESRANGQSCRNCKSWILTFYSSPNGIVGLKHHGSGGSFCFLYRRPGANGLRGIK